MEADESSELVELTDSLVYEQTGQHLEPVEKEILRQLLMGKRNDDIDVFSSEDKKLTKKYVRGHCVPKLWESLSSGLGQKVNKRNFLEVLQAKSRANYSRIALERTELNGHVAEKDSVSSLEVSYGINPNSTNCPQIPQPLNSYQECNTRLQVNRRQSNGQMGTPLPADRVQSQKVSDGSPSPTTQELQASNHTSAQENSHSSNSSNFGWLTWRNLRNFRQPGVPLLLSIGVLGRSFGSSWLANWYGLLNHLDGQLPQAQLGYRIALKLNPVMPEAHYNFGVAYEDQQNYERAHSEYQLAIEGGLVEAYNNQARLYILEGNYDAAVSLLRVGLPLAQDDRVRADMYKNRGWARLEQERLALAKTDLTKAIKLNSDRVPAYCLMAQVVEREGDQDSASEYWFKCLGFSYQPETPEQDKWVELASQRLQPQEGER